MRWEPVGAIAFLALIISALYFLGGISPIKCGPQDLERYTLRADVLVICGKPDHINYSGFKPAIHEQWVYASFWSGRVYLYIDNGKLDAVQW